jgi:preprotein translocase subunit SecA
MMAKVSSTVLVQLFEVKIERQDEIAALEAEQHARHHAELEHAVALHPGEETDDPVAALAQMQRIAAGQGPTPSSPPPARAAPRIGRNDLCPCGSGQKFKKCHGALLEGDSGEDEPEEEQPRA